MSDYDVRKTKSEYEREKPEPVRYEPEKPRRADFDVAKPLPEDETLDYELEWLNEGGEWQSSGERSSSIANLRNNYCLPATRGEVYRIVRIADRAVVWEPAFII